jgi:hypothetical protein
MQTQDSFDVMKSTADCLVTDGASSLWTSVCRVTEFGRLGVQSGAPTHYRNSWHCLRTIIAEEGQVARAGMVHRSQLCLAGVRRLWSGLLAQLVGVVHVATVVQPKLSRS